MFDDWALWIWWAATLAASVVAAQHLLGPLLVWFMQRVPASYDLKPVDIQSVISALDAPGNAALEHLATLSFAPFAASQITNNLSNLSFLLLRHPTDPAAVNIALARSPAANFSYLEFTQLFSDGMELDVNCSPTASTYPRDAQKQVFRFPDMSAPQLHAAFIKLRANIARRAAPVLSLSVEAPLTDLTRRLDEETAKLVRKGYLVATPVNGAHRLTAKAALLFTWKNTWPWKHLRIRLEAAQARRVLATLN